MKIENGKMIFETVTCWHCHGKGKLTEGISCPLYWKPVKNYPNHKCPHCKAKNRHSHSVIGEETITCYTCKGVGTRKEDPYDQVSKENWAKMTEHFQWSIQRVNRYSTFVENYIGGGGSLYGLIDYGRTNRITNDQEILTQVKTDTVPGQPIQWINKETHEVPPALIVELREDGYSVIPDWSSKPSIKPTHYEAVA